jgi:polyribonucleotide nucleotidyltransferase
LSKTRVERPADFVKEGDVVKVKLLGFDDRGKTRLSMKVVDQATGEDISTGEPGEEDTGGSDRPRRSSEGGGGGHRRRRD